MPSTIASCGTPARSDLAVLTRYEPPPTTWRDSPDHLWVLAGLPALSAHTLDRWLDGLHGLTREHWARVADESASVGATATAQLRRSVAAAIAQHRLDVVVWFLRDVVETVVYYAMHSSAHAPQFSASEIARIHQATEWAALAIAVETWLDRTVCDALIAPFELTLPLASPQLL